MGRFHDVTHQLSQLEELKGIVGSMKTLSQLELHKLERLAGGHRAMAQTLDHVAADFLHFHPRPEMAGEGALWLVIGAERGFCGDFNGALIKHLEQVCPECHEQPQRVLAVGRKLWLRLEESLPGFVALPGASVSEELPGTLAQVVAQTQQQISQQSAGGLHLLYHDNEQNLPRTRQLLPPAVAAIETGGIPPLLQLEPERFFAEFMQHYLYLALTGIFTASLLAENHYRVQHLEGAVRRLDDRLTALAGRARALRQEEITEEIEMILLGAMD